jgi:hypothetical protein
MAERTALITGGTAGIGRSFAEQLAAQGFGLVIVARDTERLAEVATEIAGRYGVEVEVISADLSRREDVDRVSERLGDTGRPIHLLVNNAGFGLKRGFLDNALEAEQEMLDVLVTAVMRLSHSALAVMTERRDGGIINVSSMAGYLPRGTYGAAKAYVTSFSQWADATYRSQGVRVMALLPGFTKTEFHERMEVSRESAPAWMWLDVDRLVRDALADFERGKMISIPGKRYKALAIPARLTPASFQARFQAMGRK